MDPTSIHHSETSSPTGRPRLARSIRPGKVRRGMKSRHRAAKFQLKVKNLERIKSFNKNVSSVDERALRSAMLSEVEVMSLTELTDLRDVKTTGSIPDEYKFHSTGTEGQQPESLHKHS